MNNQKCNYIRYFLISFFIQLGFVSAQEYSGLAVGSGNGGDLVVCRDQDGKIQSAELLDFYEARTERNILKDLGDNSLSVQSKVSIALNRLSRLSPRRAARYQRYIDEFHSEANFLGELVDVQDSDHLSIPKGCRVEQFVIQKKITFPEDKRYSINKELWDFLESNQQNDDLAGILLHEAILREVLIENNDIFQRNSISTRYFNSLITSSLFEQKDKKSFIKLAQLFPLCSIEYQGVEIKIGEYGPRTIDGKKKSGCLKGDSFFNEFDFKNYVLWTSDLKNTLSKAHAKYDSYLRLPQGKVNIKDTVYFHDNGKVALVSLSRDVDMNLGHNIVKFIGRDKNYESGGSYEDYEYAEFSDKGYQTYINERLNEKLVRRRRIAPLYLYKTGHVRLGCLSGDQFLKTTEGYYRIFKDGFCLKFSRTGLVIVNPK